MPIKGLNQVALPQAKAKLEGLKFNVVSCSEDVGSCLFRVLVFSFNPHIRKYLKSPMSGTRHLKTAHTEGPFQGH